MTRETEGTLDKKESGENLGLLVVDSSAQVCLDHLARLATLGFRAQRERAFGAHLALLALRDLPVLAMRGVRDPQDLQDHQDLPRSLVLIGRLSVFLVLQALQALQVPLEPWVPPLGR